MNPNKTSGCPYHSMLRKLSVDDNDSIIKSMSSYLKHVFSFLIPNQYNENLYPLFQAGNIDNKNRTKNRPLGALSDLVFERGDICQDTVKKLLHTFSFDSFSTLCFDQQKLAAFDLKILYAKLIHQGEKIDELRSFISNINQSLNLPDSAVPLYNELIFVNPDDDIRTFLGGEQGFQEYQFYLGHTLIEKEFEGVIQLVHTLLASLHKGEAINYITLNEEIKKHFKVAHTYMRQYIHKFKPASFNSFRHFFTIPYKFLDIGEVSVGASGANSSAMVILNSLIQGEENIEGTEYMKSFGSQDIGFHPEKDHQRLEALRELGYKSLYSFAQEKKDEDLSALCYMINKKIVEFLQIHLAVVKKHIPDAYVDTHALGTGGFPLKKSLDGSIEQKKGFAEKDTKDLSSPI